MRDLAVLALADDLSGAAETAAALLSPALRADIALADSAAAHDAHNAQNGARALVIDLDTRQSGPDRAAAAISRALAQHGRGDPQVLVKIDSLLRGNLAATVPAVGPAVFAPALPVGGRTVVDGVVRVHGVPLHETTAWGAENDPPPTSVAAAVAAPCRLISLAEVRSDPRAAIAESLAAERVPVCDAETDSDLDAVVTAALALPVVGLIGSGGLAAAVGRAWRGGNSAFAVATTTSPRAKASPSTGRASPCSAVGLTGSLPRPLRRRSDARAGALAPRSATARPRAPWRRADRVLRGPRRASRAGRTRVVPGPSGYAPGGCPDRLDDRLVSRATT